MQDATKTPPNKSSFVLMSDKNDAKYPLKIHSCKCSVQRIKIADTNKIALQSTIEQVHVPNFELVSGSEDRVLVTTVSNSSNLEGWVTKVVKNGDKKRGGAGGGG